MLATDCYLPPPQSSTGVPLRKYACSTISSSSETAATGSGGVNGGRVRTIRLVRPSTGSTQPPPLGCRHGPSLGFSLRGGREHGTGFFVSHVEVGSEAHAQGLRVGDQIVRINGFTVDDAVHKEVLQLISNHTHLTFKVRSVGMLPVKEKTTDTLSWQIISDTNSTRSSPQLSDKVQDVRINIMVAPRSKLGCGICKGPEWKPGIFIQFTKEGGIAREAGLSPGDQILHCNDVDFADIPFNEAVNLMKSSRQLELIVRKAAGSELFPGESSGYNSSASSVTGDQSPSWSDSKRLSIVKEENLDLEDRLSHLDRFKMKSKKWDIPEWEEQEEKPFFKSTIKINGPDTQIENTSPNITTMKTTMTETSLVNQQTETKTIVVDVHRSNVEERKTEINGHIPLAKSSSTSSFGSVASKSSSTSTSLTSCSLSSAIAQEIQRRNQKKMTEEGKTSIDEQIQMKKILKGVDTEKQFQHNKLMDEFKRAHEKMFKSQENKQEELKNSPGRPKASSKEEQDRLASKELSDKLSERLSNLQNEDAQNERLQQLFKKENSAPPPPPPPPPKENGTLSTDTSSTSTRSNTLKPIKTKPKAPPVPVKHSVLSYQQPPPCPTPDYDTLSISSNNSTIRPSHISTINSDAVEMESLDSFRLNNTSGTNPRPPSTYFQNGDTSTESSDSGTIRKKRPVSVTIGEYPTMRRNQPGKLNFLQNSFGDEVGSPRKGQPITSLLASELTQTLNRSNLRKRTESVENLLDSHIKPHKNGSIRISLSNSLSKSLTKSTSDLTEDCSNDFSNTFSNRVTININQKGDAPNGILKNGGFFTTTNNHKTLVQQKSITFGETPIVIKDRKFQIT